MISRGSYKFLLASAIFLAPASLALLSGCKGNTSAAASVERIIAAPPLVQAYPVATNAMVDPLAGGCWANARWMPLVAPANTERTTAPVTAATLYDSRCLYVAFVSNKPAGSVALDTVSVFLDTSAARDGSDMLQVTISNDGQAACAWLRDAEPPLKPHDDGSPDLYHPVSRIPNLPIAGLLCKTSQSVANGTPVWTAVLAIPLSSLPTPLRAAPTPGTRWKLNLLRTTLLPDTGNGSEQLQANLSPIFVGSQAVSPYRMADLELTTAQLSALPLIRTPHS